VTYNPLFQGHDYSTSNNSNMVQHGRPIESRIWSIERRHFQWPWPTPTPGFKVTLFFDAKHLRSGTRYRHNFNWIVIGTYTRPTQQCHLAWPRVTLGDLAKCSMSGLSATAEYLVFKLLITFEVKSNNSSMLTSYNCWFCNPPPFSLNVISTLWTYHRRKMMTMWY